MSYVERLVDSGLSRIDQSFGCSSAQPILLPGDEGYEAEIHLSGNVGDVESLVSVVGEKIPNDDCAHDVLSMSSKRIGEIITEVKQQLSLLEEPPVAYSFRMRGSPMLIDWLRPRVRRWKRDLDEGARTCDMDFTTGLTQEHREVAMLSAAAEAWQHITEDRGAFRAGGSIDQWKREQLRRDIDRLRLRKKIAVGHLQFPPSDVDFIQKYIIARLRQFIAIDFFRQVTASAWYLRPHAA